MADKIIIDGQELENVSGGQAGGGYNMTVGDCIRDIRYSPMAQPQEEPV